LRPFTIVPEQFEDACADLTDRAARDPAIVVRFGGTTTTFLLTGDARLRDHIGPSEELCLPRLVVAHDLGVIHVDLDGFELGREHGRRIVAPLLAAAERVWDDESGEDLTLQARRAPAALYERDPEFEPYPSTP